MHHLGRFFRFTYHNPTIPTVLMAIIVLLGIISVLFQFTVALIAVIEIFPVMALVIALGVVATLALARVRQS